MGSSRVQRVMGFRVETLRQASGSEMKCQVNTQGDTGGVSYVDTTVSSKEQLCSAN